MTKVCAIVLALLLRSVHSFYYSAFHAYQADEQDISNNWDKYGLNSRGLSSLLDDASS
eukprot:SAG31_NODE_4008_length_3669_cov_4.750420_3_plen_58_part_00